MQNASSEKDIAILEFTERGRNIELGVRNINFKQGIERN